MFSLMSVNNYVGNVINGCILTLLDKPVRIEGKTKRDRITNGIHKQQLEIGRIQENIVEVRQ